MKQDDYLYLMASNFIAVVVFLDELMLNLAMYSMQLRIGETAWMYGEGDKDIEWPPVGNTRIQIKNSFTYLGLQINAIEILACNISRAKKLVRLRSILKCKIKGATHQIFRRTNPSLRSFYNGTKGV